MCGGPVEAPRRVDSVTFRLDPCGHQIDEEVYEDLFEN